MAHHHERENWASRFGLLMAMAGMAIGLGNVWRFPYLVGYYGGGPFVFAYLVSLLLIVVPLGVVEAAFGKGIQGGTLTAWTAIAKNSKVGNLVGGIFASGYATMNFFYMSVLAGSLYFIYAFAKDMKSQMDPSIIYDYMKSDDTTIFMILTVVGTIALIYILYKGIVSGVEAVSKFMIPALFVIFLIIIIFALFTVPNIAEGYNYYLNPDFEKLASLRLWKDAVGQALFSVGVGPGCILVYGSHIKRDEDVTLSFTTVAVLDTAAALLAGFAIIPTCVALGLDPQSGSGLIFMVLPAALAQIPMGNFLGILAMLAIFFAGFTSAIAQAEVAVTSFSDAFHWNRKKTVLGIGVVTLIMGVICVYSQSQFDFWNNFAGNYVFIITAGLGAIGYNYVYGTKKIRTEYINPGSEIQLGAWFDPLVKFVCVPLMLVVMVDSLFPFLP